MPQVINVQSCTLPSSETSNDKVGFFTNAYNVELPPQENVDGGLSSGAKAGIAVGSIVGGGLVLATAWFLIRKRKSTPDAETASQADSDVV